jgi:hypothetical protein
MGIDEPIERLGRAGAGLRLASSASISVTLPFEVSLDCVYCQRRLRTVQFNALQAPGRCTPTGHLFSGRLLELQTAGGTMTASFQYQYRPFIDAKYPDRGRYVGFEAGAPRRSWRSCSPPWASSAS